MFMNKTISNESILNDHDKLFFLVTIPTYVITVFT